MQSGKLSDLSGQLWHARRFIRFHAFDTSTPEGRSDERHRKVILATIASVAAKCAALLVLAVSVPLTVRYLGAERYGLWMTIASLTAMLSSADFGIGNGIINMISESYGREDWQAAARYVSSGFFSLLAVAGVMLTAVILAYRHVPWQRWLNVSTPLAVQEAGPTVLVLVACVVVSVPLGLVSKVQTGLQQGYITHLWTIVGHGIGLTGVLICVRYRVGLPVLVLVVAGAPAFASLLNTGHLFLFQKPWLRPRFSCVELQSTKRLLNLGLLFFLYQLALILGFQSDNIVLAHVLGASKVPVYAVASRMFSVVALLMGFVIAPLWPAYGEAMARGDVVWLKRTLYRSTAVVLAVCIPANVVLVLTGKWLLRWWVGPEIVPSFALLLGIGLSQTLLSVATPLAAFLNGVNVVGKQVIFALLMAVTNITVSVYLTRRIGVPGVIYGSVIAESLFFVPPLVLLVRHTLSNLSSKSTRESVPLPVAAHD